MAQKARPGAHHHKAEASGMVGDADNGGSCFSHAAEPMRIAAHDRGDDSGSGLQGPAERAGKQVDKAMDQAGQQIEKAGQNIQDTARGDKK